MMPNDYIVTHIKTDTICEYFSNDDVVYVVDEKIVPLVRCKECRHWSYSDLIESHNRCERTMKLTKPDDFCSYGCRSEKPNNSKERSRR